MIRKRDYLKLDTGFDIINYTHYTCSNNSKESWDSFVFMMYDHWSNKENHCICRIHISKDHCVEQKIIRIKRGILTFRTQYYLLFPIEPIERLATHYYLFDFWTYFGLDEIRSLVTDKQNNRFFIAKKQSYRKI